MKRSHSFVALAIACLCLTGLRYELRARAAADTGSLPELLQLAPADATFIAYTDITALRQAPLIQQAEALAKAPKEDRDYAEFVRATGFDYQRDLDRLLVASRAGAAPGAVMAVAEGRFDQKKIEDYALRTGKVENENGKMVYVVPSVTPGKGMGISFAFLSATRVAISDGQDFFAAKGAFSAAPLDPAMQERLSRVAAAPLFFAAKTPAKQAAGTSPALSSAALFESIRWLEFAARPDGDNLVISTEGECASPEDAQKMAGTLDFLLGMAQTAIASQKSGSQLPAASASAIAHLLKGANVTATADRVRLLLTVTPDILAAIPAATATVPATPAPR